MLEGLAPAIKRELAPEMYAAGQIVQVAAQISITTGAVSGKRHVASRPGEPPKADSHHLADNIVTLQVEPLKVQIVSRASYSGDLEWGTSKIAARPFMLPAAIQSRLKVNQKLSAAARRAIRKHIARNRT